MFLVTAWYRKSWWLALLLPLSLLFRLLVWLRRLYLSKTAVKSAGDVPVIVVGNITVGGTGKTPLVIAIANLLREQGMRPGVISRGYGGSFTEKSLFVHPDSAAHLVGDEPLIIARNLQCPVVVGSDRCVARNALLEQGECDVIISDDGLQHYALYRDLEIVVIDGQRGLGNEYCLPAGPLREPPARLRQVDFIIINDGDPALWLNRNENCSAMHLRPVCWVNVQNGQRVEPLTLINESLRNRQEVHAIAGTGNPQRFFNSLAGLGINAVCHPFPDHARYNAADLQFSENAVVLMTEKDAVKCQDFAGNNCWYLAVEAVLDEHFKASLSNAVKNPGQEHAERETTHGS